MTHGTAAVILSVAFVKMRSNISTRMRFCLSSRPLLHGGSALANIKSMLMTSHIKDVIISEFSSDSSKTVYPGRLYTLIHIWNIFWMVISGFFDDSTVVADVFACSIVGIHSNAFEKSRCPW